MSEFGSRASWALGVVGAVLTAGALSGQAKRPMTFMDVQRMNQVGDAALSPDGRWMLYTLSTPDWKEARRFTDIWVVSTATGASSARQLTFTRDKNETDPQWARDGSFFVFSSNRDGVGAAAPAQLYVMRADGGEARRITDAKDGVSQFAFTKDGKRLVYAAGKADERQLWSLDVAAVGSAGEVKPVQLTKHSTPIGWWQVADDSRQIFFVAPDTVDADNKARMEKRFDVRIRNENPAIRHLWVFDLAGGQERRLTGGRNFSVASVSVSPDGKWAGVRGSPDDRYRRTVTETGTYDDLYLIEVASGGVERITENAEAGESNILFSPDSRWMAFSAPNDFVYSRDSKLYLRGTADRGGSLRKLGAEFDGPVSAGWWAPDGRSIYFTTGAKATMHTFAVDVESGRVSQVTTGQATAMATRDDASGLLLVNYSDPVTAPSIYLARTIADLGNRNAWVRLTDVNPHLEALALGSSEEITWKSRDGQMIGGVLVKPVGYQEGRRYPLVVQIHGGPAGADLLRFNTGYGSQVYAGAGYAVLLPNYRGSTNYGERHRMETAGVGRYFRRGYEDIMAGVDYLIAQGVAHPDSLGAMGWSAGGHYSNWIMTQTNRFKAISSGAGTMNWISMYAQSDVQRNRQWYMGGDLPYDNFDAYWVVSPLRYIKNAKTPTMIHVVDGDPRVPRAQSDELHMALRQLGVPVEYFVYPGDTHGITAPRNQLVKAVSEFQWFEKWIRGKDWFTWRQLLETLEEPAAGGAVSAPNSR